MKNHILIRLVLATCLLSAITSVQAQQIITYVNAENNATAISTTAPNDPTTLTIAVGSATQSGVISGTGGIIKGGAGSLTLTGNNTHTGGTTISTGTLRVGDGGLTGTLGTGAITNNAFLVFNRSNDLSVASDISGNGSLTKLGAAILLLSGTNTYSGGTSVIEGNLQIAATGSIGSNVTVDNGATLSGSGTVGSTTVSNGGILAPGISPGTLTTGNLLLSNSTQLNFELDTPDVVGGGVNDLIQVNGGLTLDGILNITDLGSFGTGNYRLFNYTGSLINFGLQFGIVPSLFEYNIDLTTAGQINLGVTALVAQFWDGSNTTPNGIVNGGTGTWDAATTNWTNAGGNANGPWAGGLGAVLAGTTGTVTIADGFTANPGALDFQTAGYTLAAAGTGAIGLTALTEITTAAGTTTISAPITGIGGIAKLGPGTLELSGTNSFTGGATGSFVEEGTLLVTGTMTQPAAGLVVANGVGSNANFEISGSVSTLQSFIGFGDASTGSASISAGSWSNDGGIILGAFGNGTLEISGTGMVTSSGGLLGVADNALGTATVSSGSWVNTGTLGIGDGAAGILNIGGTGLVSNTIGVLGFQDTATGTANISGGNWVNSLGLMLGDEGAGTVNLTSGTITAPNVSLAVETGSTGIFNVGTGTTAGILNAAVIDGGNGTAQLNFNHSQAGYFFTDNGTVSGNAIAITGSTTVQHLGSGTTILTGANTYTGGTTIANGTLQIGNGGTTGSLAGNITNNAALAFNRSDDLTFGGLISGTGSLAKQGAGVLIFTSNNSYTGGTTISTGILQIGNGGTSGSIAGNITNNAALAFNRSDNTAFNGVISGSGSLTKLGSGTLTLGGNNSYTGGTTINAGTLQTQAPAALGIGPVTLNNGTLAPLGQLNIASLDWKGGTVASILGTTTSLLNITGELTLPGVGQIQFIADSGFAANTNYNILNAANLADFTIASFLGSPVAGINPVFTILGNQLFVSFMGQSTGPTLQNSAPVFTPLNADFLVNGEVVTGRPNNDNQVNSLSFNPDSSLKIFNTLTLTSGNFMVLAGSALMTGGSVVAPTVFSKMGEGVLNILSNVFVGGAANVTGGTLLVNGSFNAPGGLNIFENAVLGGEGIIGGNVFNNGIVAPGNSPGVLTIIGNFTQSRTGTLEIELGDLLLMSGSANVGGTLLLLDEGDLSFGQQIDFLQAESISGEFNEIVMPDPGQLRGRFLSEGGIGSLLVAPRSYTQVAETTNQKNVARAMDSFIPARGNDREVVSIALDRQSQAQYPAAFDLIAPTYYESLGDIAIEQAFAQTQQMNQRMSAVRLGVRGFQAIGIDLETLVHDRDGKSVLDSREITPESAPGDPQWSLWAMGNGMFAKVTSVSQLPNYRFDSGGFLFGADHTFTQGATLRDPQLTVGVYAGYEYTWADAGTAGNTQSNTALFGGYASFSQGGFYADAIVGGGYNDYKVRRSIELSTVDRTARSQPNGGQLNTSINLGYDWEVGRFAFGPIAGVQYTYTGIGGFTESGAESLNLQVGQQNINSLRSTLGGRVAYSWEASDKILIIPEMRVLWQHEFLNNPRSINSALDGGAGPSFGYATSAPARDSVFAGAGISAQFGENWTAFIYYNIDFGRQDYLGNLISGGMGLRW